METIFVKGTVNQTVGFLCFALKEPPARVP